MEDCIVTDKGHTSKSDRCTVVEFWIQQRNVRTLGDTDTQSQHAYNSHGSTTQSCDPLAEEFVPASAANASSPNYFLQQVEQESMMAMMSTQ
eukprot:12430840-Karenia_brevis.AAC.1